MNTDNRQPAPLGIPSTLQHCVPIVPADRTVVANESGPFISFSFDENLHTSLVHRTEYSVVGGILIRRKGGTEWQAQMASPDHPNYDHGMGIEGLEPGGEYEYRWFHLDDKGERVVDPTLRTFRVISPVTDFPLDAGPWLFNADVDRISIGCRVRPCRWPARHRASACS